MNGWKEIVRDVAIIFGLTFLGGFIIGVIGIKGDMGLYTIAISNIVLGTIGFTISGCLVKKKRFTHMIKVASILWFIGLINLLFGSTIILWLESIIPIAMMMGLGGVLSFLFVKEPSTQPETNE